MSKKFVSIATVVGLLLSFSAGAAELLITKANSQGKAGGTRVALDLVTDGNVSGFNFFLRTGELGSGKVDLSACVAELPKSFSGECRAAKEGVYVFAMANARTTLPSGVSAIGSVVLPSSLAKSASYTIEELEIADVDGNSIEKTAQVVQ